MRGFDPEFADLPDYIVKITERIWEGRGIGAIRRYYADDCLMHTSRGPVRGVSAVISGTLDTLNAFPDRRLLPEDIIWAGDDKRGFLSSHRIIAPATHLGHSGFGPPSGREVTFRAIADCLCRDNRVVEEWLVRDTAGIAHQIGRDPLELGAELAASWDVHEEPWHLGAWRELDANGQFRAPELQDHAAARLVRDGLRSIWAGAELDRVRELYHPAAMVAAPGGCTLTGHERLCRWLFGLLAAVPDARLTVEHSIATGSDRDARVSTRWWLWGTHTGHGRFGAPTGAAVVLLGITHSDVIDGRVRNEWIVADEIAIHAQIAWQRG